LAAIPGVAPINATCSTPGTIVPSSTSVGRSTSVDVASSGAASSGASEVGVVAPVVGPGAASVVGVSGASDGAASSASPEHAAATRETASTRAIGVRRIGPSWCAGTVARVTQPDERLALLLDDLRRLVEVESPSLDVEAVTASAKHLATLIAERTGRPASLIDGPAGPHVHWSGGGEPKVLILGHHDTVFPLGALA